MREVNISESPDTHLMYYGTYNCNTSNDSISVELLTPATDMVNNNYFIKLIDTTWTFDTNNLIIYGDVMLVNNTGSKLTSVTISTPGVTVTCMWSIDHWIITITVPDDSGSGSTHLINNAKLMANTNYFCDTSKSSMVVSLPSNPAIGDFVELLKFGVRYSLTVSSSLFKNTKIEKSRTKITYVSKNNWVFS